MLRPHFEAGERWRGAVVGLGRGNAEVSRSEGLGFLTTRMGASIACVAASCTEV